MTVMKTMQLQVKNDSQSLKAMLASYEKYNM